MTIKNGDQLGDHDVFGELGFTHAHILRTSLEILGDWSTYETETQEMKSDKNAHYSCFYGAK